MFKIFFIFLFLFLNACKSNNNKIESKESPINNPTDSIMVKPDIVAKNLKCDTTINYDLENISSEGSEAEVCYINHKISRAKVVIYGASGRVEMFYLFGTSSVEVIERNYKYDKPLSEIKNDNDIKLLDSSKYSLSLSDGNIIKGKTINQAKEIYQVFLKTVALTIK